MEEYFVEEKTLFDKVMDFLVFVAVFVVTIFFILELIADSGKVSSIDLIQLNELFNIVEYFVLAVFSVDLYRIYKKSEGTKDFFMNSWLDILATIPFGLLLGNNAVGTQVLKLTKFSRLSRVAKAQKISRISKISKEFKAAAHLKKEGEEYQKKHRL